MIVNSNGIHNKNYTVGLNVTEKLHKHNGVPNKKLIGIWPGEGRASTNSRNFFVWPLMDAIGNN